MDHFIPRRAHALRALHLRIGDPVRPLEDDKIQERIDLLDRAHAHAIGCGNQINGLADLVAMSRAVREERLHVLALVALNHILDLETTAWRRRVLRSLSRDARALRASAPGIIAEGRARLCELEREADQIRADLHATRAGLKALQG